jgi:putative transposase
MPWTKPYTPAKNQRLDPTLYSRAGIICFVTIRAHANQSPFLREDLNRMLLDTLREEQGRQDCSVFTYCLMPDHLHFLVSPRRDGTSVLTFSDQYKGKSTNRSWKLGWQGKLWELRYYDHIVRAEEDLAAIAEYILNNPVRRGIADAKGEWPWSGHLSPLPL